MDAFLLEDLLDGHGDILVFALEQARLHFDHGHFAAEAAEHLPKLKAHVATAHDNQMRREEINTHHRGVGQIIHLVEPGQRTHPRTSAYVEKDPWRGEQTGADTHFLKGAEHSRALVK